MKLHIVPSIIALALSALIAFGMYSWCKCTDYKLLVTIAGGVSILLPIGTTLGVSIPANKRANANVKVLSSVFAIAFVISNIIFCIMAHFSMPAYIIVNGIILLIWLLLTYIIARAKQ